MVIFLHIIVDRFKSTISKHKVFIFRYQSGLTSALLTFINNQQEQTTHMKERLDTIEENNQQEQLTLMKQSLETLKEQVEQYQTEIDDCK